MILQSGFTPDDLPAAKHASSRILKAEQSTFSMEESFHLLFFPWGPERSTLPHFTIHHAQNTELELQRGGGVVVVVGVVRPPSVPLN